jgi:ring-1,2-phenylacetyl-CoA epoxidase subunit PaaA
MATQLTSEEDTRRHLKAGKLVEGLDHMSPTYLDGMKRILTVSADTEMISAPAYWRAAQDAPSLNAFGTAMSIIQDELGHAHIAYRLLEDLGVDKDWLIYDRPAGQWKYPYAFDVPLDSWIELVMANTLYDQAGYELLSDVYHSTTFGPWKRALAKVDKEETFHLRHGQQWVRRLIVDPEQKERLQRAADWMFMLTVEWFGLPDTEKRHTEQLDYGFKGKSNDQLRQAWMAKVVPFCEEVGLKVPAHWDAGEQRYVLEVPFPARFDSEQKRWLYEQGQSTWDEVLRRWKARGPMNTEFVEQLQRGRRSHA